jgi:hypothetical protein
MQRRGGTSADLGPGQIPDKPADPPRLQPYHGHPTKTDKRICIGAYVAWAIGVGFWLNGTTFWIIANVGGLVTFTFMLVMLTLIGARVTENRSIRTWVLRQMAREQFEEQQRRPVMDKQRS